ncbi:AAA family ATPase [Luteolibacter marinus]|uniref:AAA family ATPase n=1 Tax=Luteolibacter marinus TaxID=2776705 RepID=UPI00186891A8|nr:AAA family ATPase [Luteolibacter marinus]
MKLICLTLRNFRQFKGEQELRFSDYEDRNVTIVHAENGFGKSALLNALLWCFYGSEGLSDDFSNKESILNQSLAVDSSTPDSDKVAEVEVSFEHDGERFRLIRSLDYLQEKADSRKTKVTLEFTKDGQTFYERLPDQRIRSILPKGIVPLIFFEGEGPSRFALEDKSGEVETAIRQTLGLSLLQQTIDDLKHQNVRGRLRGELKEKANAETAELLERLEKLEAQVERRKESKAQAERNLNATNEDLRSVDDALEKNREVQELQKERARNEDLAATAVAELEQVESELSKVIAEDGFSLFTEELVARGKAIVTRLRNENRIPAQVLNTFIEDLLNSDRCICTRCLEPGSPERAAVERLLTTAGDQNVNNAVGAIDNALGRLAQLREETSRRLEEKNKRRLQLRDDIRVYKNRAAEIHQKIGSKDNEEVRALEDKRSVLQDRRDSLIGEIARIAQQITDDETDLSALKQSIAAAEKSEEAAKLAQRRIDALEQSVSLLEDLLRLEIEDLIPMLNKQFKEHFSHVIDRDYEAHLTDDFKLRITQQLQDGAPPVLVNPSTGQRQVASLVFIASLVSLARERKDIQSIVKGLSGADYPMVMDSPFGQLGANFRRGIAQLLPFLAPQVILFASTEQYFGVSDAVADELTKSKRIGKRYYLAYHAPTLPKEATEFLKIGDGEFQQYFRSDEMCTKICEIK